ncbi:MAG: SGNH/GDSL hydrolase family protein [Verrucomicrobiota bacterium]
MASISKILAAAAIALLPGLLRAEVSEAYFLTALAQGQRQKIVVYGTSLTANAAWPAELQSTLRASYGNKLRIINAAGGGKDSRWGLANLSSRVLVHRPDAVFIEFSINDALEDSKLGVGESMANLREMITGIRHELPYCDVIVMVMNPPTGPAFAKRSRIEDYQKGYRRVAEETSCRLISFSAVWRDIMTHHPDRWRSYAPDGLHPNKKAGDEVILPYLLRKIGFSPASESATAAL